MGASQSKKASAARGGGFSPVESPAIGVKLKHLKSLDIPADKSVHWVCEHIIKIETATSQLSYAQHLSLSRKTAKLIKSVADTFVSYVWTYSWQDLMDALSEDPDDERFVWMDVLSVNQHETQSAVQSTWMETFASVIKEIGKAELVIMPWKSPTSLKRCWCTFEYYFMIENRIPFVARCSRRERLKLRDYFLKGNVNSSFFDEIFSNIHVEDAQSYRAEDREAILRLMKKVGVRRVNDAALVPLKKWIRHCAEALVKEFRHHISREAANVHYMIGILYQSLGHIESAVIHMNRCLDINQTLSPNSLEVASILVVTANMYSNWYDDFARGENMLMRALSIYLTQRISPGNQRVIHTEQAAALNNLALIKHKQEKYDLALHYLESCQSCNERFTGNDPDIRATTLNNIALVKMDCNLLEEAELLSLECLNLYVKLHGTKDSKGIANIKSTLGQIYCRQGRQEEALRTLDEALQIKLRVYGEDHPILLAELNSLGRQLVKMDRAQQGLSYLRKSLDLNAKLGLTQGRSQTLRDIAQGFLNTQQVSQAFDVAKMALELDVEMHGEKSEACAFSWGFLAGAYFLKEEYEEAFRAFEKAAEIFRLTRGEDSAEVATALENLAKTARTIGDMNRAMTIFKECLRIRIKVLGKDDPLVAVTKANLDYVMEHVQEGVC
jgi:tetratricopeptide (TPR) repeat protein